MDLCSILACDYVFYSFLSNDNLRFYFTLNLSNNEIHVFKNQTVLRYAFLLGCDTGYYGEDCSKTCEHCINNNTFGIHNGNCDDTGCASLVY